MASTLTLSGLSGRYLTNMKIYSITNGYDTFEYHQTKAGAEWALSNKLGFDPDSEWVEEIEVL